MKSALITGGSRGIGEAMVKAFSKNGYKVAFTYKKSETAAKALAELTGALAIKADSACAEDIIRAVEEAEKQLGGIDCLINNAAISSFSLFTDITLEQWREIMDVNVTGTFLYTKAVVPGMISRKRGRIINISSMWGIVGASCEVHYSTSKAAIIGMSKALAKELGPSGITVNAIAPGVIDTEMNRNHLSEDDLRMLAEDTPLMRIGTPDEVASAALYLAGDDAGFITGDVINLSGGFVV